MPTKLLPGQVFVIFVIVTAGIRLATGGRRGSSIASERFPADLALPKSPMVLVREIQIRGPKEPASKRRR